MGGLPQIALFVDGRNHRRSGVVCSRWCRQRDLCLVGVLTFGLPARTASHLSNGFQPAAEQIIKFRSNTTRYICAWLDRLLSQVHVLVNLHSHCKYLFLREIPALAAPE